MKSWDALYPGSKGGHARDPKKYGNTTVQLQEHLWPNFLNFKSSAYSFGSEVMHRQLQLHPNTVLDASCNCKSDLVPLFKLLSDLTCSLSLFLLANSNVPFT